MPHRWGFGEVVEDGASSLSVICPLRLFQLSERTGFGVAYSVNNNTIRFTVTSMRPDLRDFLHHIEEAISETRQVMEAVINDSGGLGRSAKL